MQITGTLCCAADTLGASIVSFAAGWPQLDNKDYFSDIFNWASSNPSPRSPPSLPQVWNSVDTHVKKNVTSIIHGKYSHEETIATASFAGDYIVVKDLPEAQAVCDYILNGGDKAAFLKRFAKAVSKARG